MKGCEVNPANSVRIINFYFYKMNYLVKNVILQDTRNVSVVLYQYIYGSADRNFQQKREMRIKMNVYFDEDNLLLSQ